MTGSNGTAPADSRVEGAGPGASTAPSLVACVVMRPDEAPRVVTALADGRPGDSAGEVDLDELASILEHAAAALRGTGESSSTPRVRMVDSQTDRGAASSVMTVGQLQIHAATRLVLRSGQPVPLSRIEFDLLLALVRRDGEAASRLELVREVWGYGAAVTSRSVDTQVYNLRHKLEENPSNPRHLLTVSGVGYRLAR